MTSRRSATIAYMVMMIVVQRHSTSGISGFSCDFGTLNPNTGKGLHDCDVTQASNSPWRIISGNNYSAKYWLDTTWQKNGGFFISWSRDQNGRSIFHLPHYRMSTAYGQLSFLYKFFGTGQSRLRVRLCNDVIFDVTDMEEKWIRSPELLICCYAEGWNFPEISFEATWSTRSGKIAVDAISVEGMTSVDVYENDGGSCRIHTSSSPTTTASSSRTTTLLSSTMQLQATEYQTTTAKTLSVTTHPFWNISSPLSHVRSTEIGSTAFVSDVPLDYTPAQPNSNSSLGLVKTLPIKLALFLPTASLVIVVVGILLFFMRKYCWKCRSRSKEGKLHQGSCLTEQQEHVGESTYQCIDEPITLQTPKIADKPEFSREDANHSYRDCKSATRLEREIPLSLRLSANKRNDHYDDYDNQLIPDGSTKKPTSVSKLNPTAPLTSKEKPFPHPKPRLTGLGSSLRSENGESLQHSLPDRYTKKPISVSKLKPTAPLKSMENPLPHPKPRLTGLRSSSRSENGESLQHSHSLPGRSRSRESVKKKTTLQPCRHVYFRGHHPEKYQDCYDVRGNPSGRQEDTKFLPKKNGTSTKKSTDEQHHDYYNVWGNPSGRQGDTKFLPEKKETSVVGSNNDQYHDYYNMSGNPRGLEDSTFLPKTQGTSAISAVGPDRASTDDRIYMNTNTKDERKDSMTGEDPPIGNSVDAVEGFIDLYQLYENV